MKSLTHVLNEDRIRSVKGTVSVGEKTYDLILKFDRYGYDCVSKNIMNLIIDDLYARKEVTFDVRVLDNKKCVGILSFNKDNNNTKCWIRNEKGEQIRTNNLFGRPDRDDIKTFLLEVLGIFARWYLK